MPYELFKADEVADAARARLGHAGQGRSTHPDTPDRKYRHGHRHQQLPKTLLRAADFKPTKFHDGAAKADFGNSLLAFIAADFPRPRFTLRLYHLLNQHFGMIAHCDIHGFWAEYFTSTAAKLRFLNDLVSYPCWGDPAFTFSDLERAVIARLRSAGLVERLREALAQETEAAERALLNRLQARYQPEKPPVAGDPWKPSGNWASDQGSLL